jgi:endonuclease I
MDKFKPCDICIQSIRDKFFKIKSDRGMIPFNRSKEFIKNNMYDMYSGSYIDKKQESHYNIEHIVPAAIFTSNRANENVVEIDKEPYHDPHILFPTLKDVNTLRANYVFGNVPIADASICVKDFGKTALVATDSAKIIVDAIDKREIVPDYVDKSTLEANIDNVSVCIDTQLSRMQSLGPDKSFPVCSVGDCTFAPATEFKGDIARCVFYFYIMYAYDPSVRPYTKTENWLTSTKFGRKCELFPKWDKFFIDHLEEYYEWAKNDPISDAEELRNIKLNLYCGIPNIFVGYISNTREYYKSDFQLIDELLFSKPHEHSKYTDINVLFQLPDPKKAEEVRNIIKSKIEKYSRSHCILSVPSAILPDPSVTPPVTPIVASTGVSPIVVPSTSHKVRSPISKKPKIPPVAIGGFRRSLYKFDL